ncbi:MAG: phage-shock protein [Peptococcaceae bacterium]|nr:phage-shock protein [Peptococcaceae bacterium]
MNGKLLSLTDVLKKTLFFFEALTPSELTGHVHKRMLQDLPREEVEEKVGLCLEQHGCFNRDDRGLWHLDLEGSKENDQFFAILLKKGEPQSLREMNRTAAPKKSNTKTKKLKKIVSDEGNLISDGRFVQLDNGNWGLTEWEIEAGQYSLKNLVIRALKLSPESLSLSQVLEKVGTWQPAPQGAVSAILRKYPFFEEAAAGLWSYNPVTRILYDELLKRFTVALKRQKARWQREKERMEKRQQVYLRRLEEVDAARREAAVALAERMEMGHQKEHLLTQLAEKDLLLALRKKEIMSNREHIRRVENKGDSILHQCRLWVRRARDAEDEVRKLREAFSKNQGSLENLFLMLQNYKEKEREFRTRLATVKDQYEDRIADMQRQEIELKERTDKEKQAAHYDVKKLHEQLKQATHNLKAALGGQEELNRTLRFTQSEAKRLAEENRRLKASLRNPFIRMILSAGRFFSGRKKAAEG